MPRAFSLGQSFPNPFNPSATISYSVPGPTDVTIKVFDEIGREVTTLVHGKKAAGNYSVVWNASRYASGVYWYRMTAGSYSETRKMLLIK